MDFAFEMRKTYLGAVPHTIFTALVWIGAAIAGDQFSPVTGVLVFIIGGTFIFPGGELLRKLFGHMPPVSTDNTYPRLFMWLAFTIPASYPLIYLACRNDINLFFPAFTILIGAHYLPFVYGYRMVTFLVLAVVLLVEGTICAIMFSDSFTEQAYLTGITLLVFALINYFIVKKEI